MARVKRPDRTPPGRLRIVAGKWRSRRLPVINAPGLRPTSDRIRETLFNWLDPIIEGADCLDLFAGTGALGIEALSRGAAHVVFVDCVEASARSIRRNLHDLGAENFGTCRRDAFDYLTRADARPFDIVFLDPPFDMDVLGELCELLQEHGWLSNTAVVYLEQGSDRQRPALPEGWAVSHEKVAGKVSYSLVATKTRS